MATFYLKSTGPVTALENIRPLNNGYLFPASVNRVIYAESVSGIFKMR
jgi:hypothetical protein